MALINAQFSTVTVRSGTTEHSTSQESGNLAPDTYHRWGLLLRAAQQRHRANARARMELLAKGVDPDQFLAYHRR